MPSNQERQDGLIISATVLTILSILVVLVRLVTRCFILRKPGLDDLTISGASLATIAYLIELYINKANHVGFPMTTLSLTNLEMLMKSTLAIEITYYICVSLIKISILFMYLRFAVSPWFLKATIGTIIFHSIFFVVCIVVTMNQCTPLKKWWDVHDTVEGHCINTTAFFYSTSSINIVTDFWILCLPISSLKAIQRPKKEKYALMAVFSVSCFAAITSIIRLKSIKEYTQATDPILSALSVNVWSEIEINVAIICASVPALKPLFNSARLINPTKSNPKSSDNRPNFISLTRMGYSKSVSDKNSQSDENYDLEHSIRPHTSVQSNQSGRRSQESSENIVYS